MVGELAGEPEFAEKLEWTSTLVRKSRRLTDSGRWTFENAKNPLRNRDA